MRRAACAIDRFEERQGRVRVRSDFSDHRIRRVIQSGAAAMAMPAAKDTAVL
jgi:hypothetical protein